MKRKYTLLWITIFLYQAIGFTTYAQTPWSVEVMAATGLSGTITNSNGSSSGSGSQYQVLVHYHFGRMSVGTGLAYLKSGYDNNSDSTQISNTPNISFYENFRTKHIMVPLTWTYRLPVGGRFSLDPSAGLAFTYNINAQMSQGGLGLYKKEYTGSVFEQYFNRYSLWAQAGLQLSCKVNEQLSIRAGLQAQAMLTGLQKNLAAGDKNLRLFTVFADLGLAYRF